LRKRLHRFGSRIAVLAGLALLLAQLGATSHAYSHDATAGYPDSHQAAIAGHDACNECLAYAPLLCSGGTPTALPPLDFHPRGLAVRATADSRVDLDLTLAFRSRAPPITT
jgi:hypothetical protein